MHISGPILVSKGMRAIYQKKGKKQHKKVWKGEKSAKYLKIWAKMYKIRKYFVKEHVIACGYRT